MKTNPLIGLSWHLVFIVLIFILLFPIIFAVGTSFRPLEDAYNNVLQFIPLHPTFENYEAFFTSLDVARIMMNTFFIAAGITIFKVVTSFLAAYAFVYLDFKGKNLLYFLFISTMFIPFAVTMIPNYLVLSDIGLTDSVWG